MRFPRTAEEAQRIAEQFIASLPYRPVRWKLGGSWARGEGKPGRSDVDVLAWFEGADEDALLDCYQRGKPIVDFHWFCHEWAVYKHDPALWRKEVNE